ncbi:MAG: hypothetical protein R3F56_12820 [Planctomycetota bacterium]
MRHHRESPATLLTIMALLAVLVSTTWYVVAVPSAVPMDLDSTVPAVAAEPSVPGLQEGERATVADRGGHVRLRVTEAGTGQGVHDAEVRVARATRAPDAPVAPVMRTDRAGAVWFAEEPGDVIVAVRRPGFVPQVVERSAGPAGIEVALTRACGIELTFRDAAGRPVVGVPVRLLPEPIGATPWGGDWYRCTSPEAVSAGDARRLARVFAQDSRDDRRASQAEGEAPPLARPDLTQPTRAAVLALALPLDLPGGRACDPMFRLIADQADRISDERGVVRWDELPPGEYRWGLCAPMHATIVPAHENTSFERVEGGVLAGRDPVPLLSGRMQPRPGEMLRFSIETIAGARVRGRVQTGTPGAAGQVALVHRRLFGDGDAAVESHRVEATVDLGADGSFVFDNVGPGIHVVRSAWWTTPSDLHYAAVSVEVAAGDDRDVGVLQPTEGTLLEANLRLVDRRGEVLDPVALFGRPIEVFVGLEVVPDSRRIDMSLSEMIAFPVGQQLRVHGVAAGRAWLRATRTDDARAVDGSSAAIVDAPVRELRLPVSEPVDVALRVDRLRDVEVEVSLPAEASATRLEFWLRARSTGEMRDLRTRVRGAQARVQLTLPEDEYDVFARTCTCSGGAGAFGFGALTVGSGTGEPARLQLGAAAGLRGRVVASDGRPLANEALEWHFARAGSSWIVRARTGADGRFDLPGLIPGSHLRDERLGLGVQVPALGAVGEVELISARGSRR